VRPNLLLNRGSLAAVIDFGQLAVGDPACDLAIAWTLLRGDNREAFRKTLGLDRSTWQRGRAWALWKAMIVAAGMTTTNADEGVLCWQVIDEVLAEHAQTEAQPVAQRGRPACGASPTAAGRRLA
jgi:aminoglycoside phosphotransferase (APT) family kinase protein